MVLPLGHRQGLRKASGLAAATHPDDYPVLNQAENNDAANLRIVYIIGAPPQEGKRFR